MSKQDQNSIIQPSEEELIVYKQLVQDINEAQMDELANDYFRAVSEEGLNISFPRFLINKIMRPIKPGDTINIQTTEGKTIHLCCVLREFIEEKEYLLFCEADPETEELQTEVTYLFYVCGVDTIGTEELDIMPAGPETEQILDILEVRANDAVSQLEVSKVEEQKQEGNL